MFLAAVQAVLRHYFTEYGMVMKRIGPIESSAGREISYAEFISQVNTVEMEGSRR
jgi:hypothetical protein